ncbi:MAG: hypothetical protein K5984_07735 [Bacteroidales bacterium]|jgi:hypothetical protein|nr:hypothetical protein [Bacteroidales bacterium]
MLEELRKDIERLISLYESEKAEKERLAVLLSESKAAEEAGRKHIAELEHQMDNLKLSEAFRTPEGGDSAAKERIAKLIKEIDKCISLLEK